MTRRIEAQAVLSAKDVTGGVFERLTQKFRRLSSAAEQAERRSAGAVARSGTAIAASAGAAARARGGGALAAGMGASAAGMAGRVIAPTAMAYGGVRAFQRFASVEEALLRIGITADASDEQIKEMEGSLRGLAIGTGKSFTEVAGGVDALVTGGLELQKALQAIPAIAKTAQASGSEIADVSNSTLALTQNLGIAADKMQSAFDIMVAGGKAGKFELKDMARYLPSIIPAAVAVGMKGEEGLKRLVTALQVVRAGTGSTEEAASSMSNVFAKMESEQTAKRFAKMGINLGKEMAKARKEGKDLLEVFVDLSHKALKGDLSKVPQLFSDMEFARGMRALLSYRDLMKDIRNQVDNAKGAADKDFNRVMKLNQIELNKLSESFDRATTALGAFASKLGASKGLNWLSEMMEAGVNNMEAHEKNLQSKSPAQLHLESELSEDEKGLRTYAWLNETLGPNFSKPGGYLRKTEERLRRQVEKAKHEQGWMDAAREAILADAQGTDPLRPPVVPGTPLPRKDPRGRAPVPPHVPLPLADPRGRPIMAIPSPTAAAPDPNAEWWARKAHLVLTLRTILESRDNDTELVSPVIFAVSDLIRAHPRWADTGLKWIEVFDDIDLRGLRLKARDVSPSVSTREALAALLFNRLLPVLGPPTPPAPSANGKVRKADRELMEAAVNNRVPDPAFEVLRDDGGRSIVILDLEGRARHLTTSTLKGLRAIAKAHGSDAVHLALRAAVEGRMRVQPLQTRLISALAELLAMRPDVAAQPEAFIRAIAELPLQEMIAQTRVSNGSKPSSRMLLGMLMARLKLPATPRPDDGDVSAAA